MSGRTFVDSNVLIYAHDANAGEKQERATEHLAKLWASAAGVLSTQVLQEFYVNVTRKIPVPLPAATAREVVRDYATWSGIPITPATVLRASEISEIWQVSFWDSMIIASAEENGAERILTEDLSAGTRVAGIEIVNPLGA